MKKYYILSLLFVIGLYANANPWGHRYSTEQSDQNITTDINTPFTVSVEWGEGDWTSSSFGYGLTTDGTGWTWVNLPYFENGSGDNKRCKASISIDAPGKYYYAYRFVKSGTTSYSFGSDAWAENSSTLNATSYISVGKYTVADGNWSSTSVWNNSEIPNNANVGIYNSINLDGNVSVKNLDILNHGTLNLNNYTVTISSGGTLTNIGTFTTATGTVSFAGAGTVSGTVAFNNVTMAGGVDFGSSSTINGALTINSGGYVTGNAPAYGTGSTLIYNTGGTYGRSLEWSATSGAGYPYNVLITNSTSVNLGANSGTGTERDIAGNLTIDTVSALYMNYSSDDMTKPLVVNGNVTINGTLSLSDNTGGDLKLKGNLVFGQNSTFNANSRAIFFNGQTTQTVQATNATTYNIDYIVVGEVGGSATTLQLVDVDIVCGGPQGGHALSFANATDKIDLNGRKFTLGATGVSSDISGTGEFTGSSTSQMEIDGTGDISLNFDQTTAGTTNALKILLVARTSGTVTFGNDVAIPASGVWTINANSHLTVSGSLTNNAGNSGLVIKSDANGNGSLILSSGNPAATVQRYIAAYSATANGWHEIGSPVNNMAISGSAFAPGTSDDLYAWDESNNIWSNYKQSNGTHPFSTFTNGQGYLVASNSTGAKSFTGTLNNGNIIFNNMSYNTTQGNGWHLLGNPYPSALTWGDANWSLTNVGGVAKVWNESGGNYSDISSGGVIPSTNGFFVQVTNTTNSLNIPAADRVHDAVNNYKSVSATTPNQTLNFKVTNDANGYYDVSRFGFKSNATEGFDQAFDSHKLFTMVKTAPSLWTVSNKQDFSTDYIPETTSAYSVPLNFKPGVSTVYHLTIKGVDSFNGTSFVLEDLQTGDKIDLSTTKEYDFSAKKVDDVNRFVLHINGVTAVPNVNATDGVHVFSYGKTIHLYGQKALNGNVSIFNTLGQKVYEGKLNGTAKQQIRLNQQNGIYLVRVEENNHVITKKVFIQ